MTIVDAYAFMHSERLTRREAVRHVAVAGSVLFVSAGIAGCNEGVTYPGSNVALDFTSDFGVLSYLYGVEQLSADFWTRVTQNLFPGATALESATFARILAHEAAHRAFYESVIPDRDRISAGLFFDFSSVSFANRESVMAAARSIEDGTAAAYIGATKYLRDPAMLGVVAKIASIESRHAATVRDLGDIADGNSDTLARRSFAGDDIIAASGLDATVEPAVVLSASGIGRFFRTTFSVRGL